MKGISTIIATILMLAITIALAGTAYLYISGALTGKISTSFSLVYSYTNTVTIRNDGIAPITSFTKVTVDGNPASYSVSAQDSSLVGYWKFDDYSNTVAKDSSGRGNDGTYAGENFNNGTIYGATFASGQYGSALNFDGIDDNVSASTTLGITTPFTISAWIKIKRKTFDTEDQLIVGKGTNYILNIFGTGRGASVGIVEFWWLAAGGVWSTITVDDDKWYNIVGSWDGATQRIYINGELRGSRTTSIAPTTDTTPLKIGEWTAASDRSTFGLIDEVRIYNRSLSQTEIQEDMNSRYPANRTGLIASYSFEEGSGNIAYDTHNLVAGKYNSGMSFDGINDVINIPNFGGKMPTSEITIIMWIKPVINTGARDLFTLELFDIGGGRVTSHWGWNDNQLHWQFGTPYAATTAPLNSAWLNEWAMYTFVASTSTPMMKIYRNTAEIAPVGGANSFTQVTGTNWNIGGRSTSPFNGTIDEVKIYNRALTAEEISAIYTSTIGDVIFPGSIADIKILDSLSPGTHTIRICTPSMCNTAYINII